MSATKGVSGKPDTQRIAELEEELNGCHRRAAEDANLFLRVRANLQRWAARYAEAPHARLSVKETRLLIDTITERLGG